MLPFFACGARAAALLFCCAVLSGCVVETGAYPQSQSMETAVQIGLAKQGYYRGPIDGCIGPTTSRAIRNYQRDHQLAPTGTITPALAYSLVGSVQETTTFASYYPGYVPRTYYPGYIPRTYYAPPPTINLGWGVGWPVGGSGWWGNRGYGGYEGDGYRRNGYNGYNYNGYNDNGNGYRWHGGGYGYRGYGNSRGWCR